MAFEMSYDDIPDLDKIGGLDQVAPGDYHALIEAIEEDGERGDMEIDLQILRGTTPGQEGKPYKLRLKKDYGEWPQRRLAAFAIASRLRTAEEIKRNKAERRSDPIEWSNAAGRSICLSLGLSQDGKWTNLNYDNIWLVEDKRAARIPLHPETVKREGVKLPANRPIDGILSKSAQQPAAAAKKSAGKPAAGDSIEDALDGVI